MTPATTATTTSAREVHRTAVFALHMDSARETAALERVFRLYTRAYTDVLAVCRRCYDVDALRGLATYTLTDAQGGTKPRLSARTLAQRLYADERVTRVLAHVSAPLESRLRQSLREHVAMTLLSYVAIHDAQAEDASRGGAPAYPSRLRRGEVERARLAALAGLAAPPPEDVRAALPTERALVAQLLATRQSETVAIPFVGVAPEYGCGLYLNPVTRRFYARLDCIGNSSHHGRAIAARGTYVDIKTGVPWVAAGQPVPVGGETFGRGRKSLLIPLEMGRWH